LNSVGAHNWWIFSEHPNAVPVTSASVQEIGNHLENVEPGKAFLISDSTLKQIFLTQHFLKTGPD
jgi:hypothetical protein